MVVVPIRDNYYMRIQLYYYFIVCLYLCLIDLPVPRTFGNYLRFIVCAIYGVRGTNDWIRKGVVTSISTRGIVCACLSKLGLCT